MSCLIGEQAFIYFKKYDIHELFDWRASIYLKENFYIYVLIRLGSKHLSEKIITCMSCSDWRARIYLKKLHVLYELARPKGIHR